MTEAALDATRSVRYSLDVSDREDRPIRKHRHDGPDVAHAAHSQARTTRALQLLLGACIVLTGALVIYAVLSANLDLPATH
ncbi:MAG: hypothetical protein D6689_02855 [Deltaproteobacteria bacterium]|nr:MAG: hypothetical protein D6689_02855 [Deltaproteobacteria bacterium]